MDLSQALAAIKPQTDRLMQALNATDLGEMDDCNSALVITIQAQLVSALTGSGQSLNIGAGQPMDTEQLRSALDDFLAALDTRSQAFGARVSQLYAVADELDLVDSWMSQAA